MRDDTDIHGLVVEGQLADIRTLTKTNPSLVNARNDFNETPLILSLKHKHNEVTHHFLELPVVDFHHQSYSYGTALVAAVYFNNREAAQQLIEKEKQTNNGLFEPKKHPGLLLCAIRSNNGPLVDLFIREGVDINDPGRTFYQEPPYGFDNEDEPTPFDPYGPPVFELPIIVALQDACIEVIPVLLAHHPDMDKKGVSGLSANDLIQSGRLRQAVCDILPQKRYSTTLFAPDAAADRSVYSKAARSVVPFSGGYYGGS